MKLVLLLLVVLVFLAGCSCYKEEDEVSPNPPAAAAAGTSKGASGAGEGAVELASHSSSSTGPITNKFHTCRNPDLGGQVPADVHEQQKYLLITGGGAGIGNFLIFYPAAFYFAVLSGRDIVVMDDSLIGEMCRVLHCG